ncbi:MAG: thioredoxin family protein [Candidatus Aenigmatarchaeota archaeon]
MKKYLGIISFLAFLIILIVILASISKPSGNYTQEIGYSDKIEEAIIKCDNCNVCPDGKNIIKENKCIYFFWGRGCPHCAEEKPFLEELKKKYPKIEIYDFEVYYNYENTRLWREVCKKYNTEPSGVPMTFIGDKVFIGFVNRGFYTNSSIPSSYFVLSFFPLLAVVLAFLCLLAVLILARRVKIKVRR